MHGIEVAIGVYVRSRGLHLSTPRRTLKVYPVNFIRIVM
jgi:hypothetical protein